VTRGGELPKQVSDGYGGGQTPLPTAA